MICGNPNLRVRAIALHFRLHPRMGRVKLQGESNRAVLILVLRHHTMCLSPFG